MADETRRVKIPRTQSPKVQRAEQWDRMQDMTGFLYKWAVVVELTGTKASESP